MEYFIIIILVIIIWLIWSRYYVNKKIKECFEFVSTDNPIICNYGLREIFGYCKKQKLESHLVGQHLIVMYKNKVVTVKQEGGFRIGQTVFLIQDN